MVEHHQKRPRHDDAARCSLQSHEGTVKARVEDRSVTSDRSEEAGTWALQAAQGSFGCLQGRSEAREPGKPRRTSGRARLEGVETAEHPHSGGCCRRCVSEQLARAGELGPEPRDPGQGRQHVRRPECRDGVVALHPRRGEVPLEVRSTACGRKLGLMRFEVLKFHQREVRVRPRLKRGIGAEHGNDERQPAGDREP